MFTSLSSSTPKRSFTLRMISSLSPWIAAPLAPPWFTSTSACRSCTPWPCSVTFQTHCSITTRSELHQARAAGVHGRFRMAILDAFGKFHWYHRVLEEAARIAHHCRIGKLAAADGDHRITHIADGGLLDA